MRFLIKPVLGLSALGLFLSIVVHVAALLGIDLQLGQSVFALHIGIFVVWFPAVYWSTKLGGGRKASMWGFRGTVSLKEMLSGCPAWMTYAMYGLFAYTFANFFLAIANGTDHAGESVSSPERVRLFSGHWMLFYYAAFAIAYSALMKPELLGDAVCNQGHKALRGDKFCSECGGAVSLKKFD
jgi:hypothetical protein